MAQVKNSFDKETKSNIGKGLVLNFIGALGALATSYMTTGNVKGSLIIAGSSFLSSVANIIKEYVKGDE